MVRTASLSEGLPIEMTAAEAARSFGRIQDNAFDQTVIVTRHGKPSLALVPFGLWSRADSQALQTLTHVLDQIEEAYLGLDHQWKCTSMNRAAEQYFGLDRSDILGRDLWEAFPPIVGTEAEGHLRRAMDQGAATSFPWKSVVRSGRSLVVRAFPVPGAEGGIGVIFSSIAETQRLTSLVAVEKSRTAALMSELPGWAVIDLDQDGVVTAWDDQAESLLGWSRAEMLGRSVETIYAPDAREGGSIWREMASARREGRSETRAVHISKSGEEVRCLDLLVRASEIDGQFFKILRPDDEVA